MNEAPASPAPTAPKASHGLEWFIWSALILTVLAIAVAFTWTRVQDGGIGKTLEVKGEVPDFTLTNQFGQTVSRSNLLGQIWVGDVIFTTCPMSCERMTQRMRALQKDISPSSGVKFVSLTVNPLFDTPPVLKRYAERHEADQTRWHFLTGLKTNVYDLGINGLKFAVLDNTNRTIPEDLFLHSTQFVLVDKHGKIRAWFEGTDEVERQQLLRAVKKLAREK